MDTTELRRRIKNEVDHVPADRLDSLADYVQFLSQPTLAERLTAAQRDMKAGKGVAWREVRADV